MTWVIYGGCGRVAMCLMFRYIAVMIRDRFTHSVKVT